MWLETSVHHGEALKIGGLSPYFDGDKTKYMQARQMSGKASDLVFPTQDIQEKKSVTVTKHSPAETHWHLKSKKLPFKNDIHPSKTLYTYS
jgi:hypothetical protein